MGSITVHEEERRTFSGDTPADEDTLEVSVELLVAEEDGIQSATECVKDASGRG